MSIVQEIEPLPVEDWRDVVVDLLPRQGAWSDDAYLWLTDYSRRMVELNDGRLEVLPMPTDLHQSILKALFLAFHLYLDPRGGNVQFAALRLRIREGKFREPDLLLVVDKADPRRQDRFWIGADLVAEIISPDHPERDTQDKLVDYAAAKIAEYWIVDPQRQTISVFTLVGDAYELLGEYRRGTCAMSRIVEGFSVKADAILDAS